MQDVYRNGKFENDPWRVAAAGEPVPNDGRRLVSKPQLLELLASGGSIDATFGVLIEAGETLDDLAPALDRLALVAVNFAKFNDGRGFSIARLLRERFGYKGPLRAVGDVLLDLMPHMERVGFTEFTIVNEPTRRALAAGPLPEMPVFYQPAWSGDTDEAPVPAGRPWLRRAV